MKLLTHLRNWVTGLWTSKKIDDKTEQAKQEIAAVVEEVVEIVDACAHINLFDLGRAGAQQSSVAHAKAAVVLQRRPWLRVHSVS